VIVTEARLSRSPMADILYLGDRGTTLWLNECGNRLVAGPALSVPKPDALRLSALGRVDGKTTASLVLAEKVNGASLTIIDLVAEPPLLLVREDDGMGLRTTIAYGTSTAHLLADRVHGVPWRTRLPIPLHVVTRVTVEDRVRGTSFTSSYRYHHGHWDPAERELRGFAAVEQIDAEIFESHTSAHQHPSAQGADLIVTPISASAARFLA